MSNPKKYSLIIPDNIFMSFFNNLQSLLANIVTSTTLKWITAITCKRKSVSVKVFARSKTAFFERFNLIVI